MLLVGDIGGTHARLALVSYERAAAVAEEVVPSQSHAGLDTLARDFLRRHAASIDRAVFAVAGPVVGGHVELTNLGWTLDENRLREALEVRSVRLINDLLALAYAVPCR